MFEDVITTLDAVIDALDTASVAYALCGGLAVNLHGHVRATRDIDLLLPADQLDGVRARWRSRDVWTVSLDGLARMKRLAGRPQDLADLDNLGLDRDEEESP